MSWRKPWCFTLAPALVALAVAAPAGATPPPNQDAGWDTATSVTVGAAGAIQLLMPRIFYSDPEATVGWKARWHVSQLAPVLTLTVLSLVNEYGLKPAIQDPRPGCDDTNKGAPQCATYGSPSTHAFAGFSALGNGAAVWLFDMTKWSDGRFNVGSFVGNLAVPFVLAGVTGIGRGVGNFENADQILLGGLTGLAFGFLTGMTYTLMQRPECGYTGSMICW